MFSFAFLLTLMMGASSGGASSGGASSGGAPAPTEGSAPPAKKRKMKRNTTFKFSFKEKEYKIECSIVKTNGTIDCIAHFPSNGVSKEMLIAFWKYLKMNCGVNTLFVDSNITKDKTELEPNDLAKEFSVVCPSDMIFVPLVTLTGKDRVRNWFWNPQFWTKCLFDGSHGSTDTDGMLIITDAKTSAKLDFDKMTIAVVNKKTAPFCRGYRGTVKNFGKHVEGKCFDSSDSIMMTDHSVMTLVFKDGFTKVFGSGAELHGQGNKTMKPHSIPLYKDKDAIARMNKLSDDCVAEIIPAFNKFFGNFVGKEFPPFLSFDTVFTKESQKKVKKLIMTKEDAYFTSAEQEAIKANSDAQGHLSDYIEFMKTVQIKYINLIYKDADVSVKASIIATLEAKYEQAIKGYFEGGRWDKLLICNFVDAQLAAGFEIPDSCAFIDRDGFAAEINKRVPQNGVFYLCEAQPHKDDTTSLSMMSEDGNEGTLVVPSKGLEMTMNSLTEYLETAPAPEPAAAAAAAAVDAVDAAAAAAVLDAANAAASMDVGPDGIGL